MATNDLTQTTYAYSRDVLQAPFLPTDLEAKILDVEPFQTIDRKGVGKLIRIAVVLGRRQTPASKSASAANRVVSLIRSTSATPPGSTTFPARRREYPSRACQLLRQSSRTGRTPASAESSYMLPITNYRDREVRLLSQGAAFGIASKGRVLPESDDGVRSPVQKVATASFTPSASAGSRQDTMCSGHPRVR